MPTIHPFRGIIYNKDKLDNLNKVLAPPYDVISPSEQDFYYQRCSYNIIRIILGKDKVGDNLKENKYARAANFFRDWLSGGILKKEKSPAFYTYYQKYDVDGKQIERRGLIALMKLDDFFSGMVFPHERVFPNPREDRFNLLRICQANFSAVFTLFSDPEKKIDFLMEKEEFIFKLIDDDKTEHKLFAIRNQELINKICCFMRDKKVFIADGHHRYLTALRLMEEVKNSSFSFNGAYYIMVYFLNMDSPAVTILSVHRLLGALTKEQLQKFLKAVEQFFYKRPFEESIGHKKEELRAERFLSEIKRTKGCGLGMYTKEEGYFLLFPKNPEFFSKRVKSALLDQLIRKALNKKLEKGKEIDFTTSAADAVKKVQKGKFQMVFFFLPVSMEEIKNVVLAGEKMPPKSSYFHPKPLSGLVMRDLKDAI